MRKKQYLAPRVDVWIRDNKDVLTESLGILVNEKETFENFSLNWFTES